MLRVKAEAGFMATEALGAGGLVKPSFTSWL